jgi:hypothetical protein
MIQTAGCALLDRLTVAASASWAMPHMTPPRFFYEIHDGGRYSRDDEGQEFADREAARKDAISALVEMACALPSRNSDQNKITASLRDEIGKLIFTATLSLDVQWND